MKFKEEHNKLVAQEEQILKDFYKKRIEYLDKELEVRLSLGVDSFKKLNPTFEYENAPEFLEHQVEGLKLTIEEEKAKIQISLNDMERKRMQREEMEEMANGRK